MKNILIAGLGAVALITASCRSSTTKPPEYPVGAASTGLPGSTKRIEGGAAGYYYEQRLYASQPALYSPEDAQNIIDQFRTNYPKLGNPRILIYVNRELVDEKSGLKLSGRNEHVETTHTTTSTNAGDGTPVKNDSTTTRSTANNSYTNSDRPAPTLADRQTVRDVERLMGRPMRSAGASLVDQNVAAQMIGERPLDTATPDTDQGRRDREAVGKIADVVIEVLMSSRSTVAQELNGEHTYSVPDIQATAVRLKDSKVIGQATAADVINRAGGPANTARNFTVQDITEATSLSLMQDMMTEAK